MIMSLPTSQEMHENQFRVENKLLYTLLLLLGIQLFYYVPRKSPDPAGAW